MSADDIFTMYCAARHEHGPSTPLEWQVGRDSWFALRNLKAADGQYLWTPGIGTASPVYFMGYPIRLVNEDGIRIVPQAATGDTQRLETRPCRECGDATPAGARFCIAYGAPMEMTQ